MRLVIFTALLLLWRGAVAQIAVEVFGGSKKTTVDVMFFKFFKNKEMQHSKWLFFNRNRSSIDYKMTHTNTLPQFGFTEAISYNDQRLIGFAPVVVASVLNSGVYPKAGFQFSKVKSNYTIFSWLVAEILKQPTVDFFFLGRYTPKLTDQFNLFTQIELINAFPTAKNTSLTLIQRARLGLKIKACQFGLGTDFSAMGKTQFTNTQNMGGFLRFEF